MNRPIEAATYRALLRLPTAGPFFAASTLARLSYGTVTLSLLLAVRTATGSFTAAGWTLAGYAIPALLMPAKAAVLDAFGQRLPLAAMSLGYATSLSATVGCAAGHVHNAATFVALAVVAGIAVPPLGPATRARWSRLAPDDGLRKLAFGLDTVVEESLYVAGPLMVAGLSQGPAVLPLAVTAASNVVGTVGMSAVHGPGTPRATLSIRRRSPLHRADRTLFPLVGLMFAVGLGVSPIEIAVLSYTHSSVATGLLLAVMSIASVVGGLVWARRAHDGVFHRYVPGLLALAAVGMGGVALTTGLHTPSLVLAVGLVTIGVCTAPIFTAVYLAADHTLRRPDGVSIQSGTWINTGYNAGFAAGSAAAGIAVSAAGAPTALAAGAAILACAGARSRHVRWASGPPVDDRPE